MVVALEELQDLRGVWSSLSKVWTQIDDTRERPWLSVQPRKLRYFVCYIFHHIFVSFIIMKTLSAGNNWSQCSLN